MTSIQFLFNKLKNIWRTQLLICIDIVAEIAFKKYKITHEASAIAILKYDLIGDYLLFREFILWLKESSYNKHKIILIGHPSWMDLSKFLDRTYIDEWHALDAQKFNTNYSYRFLSWKWLHKINADIWSVPVYSRTYLMEQIIRRVNTRQKTTMNVCMGTNINSRQAAIAKKYYTQIIDTGEINLFEWKRNYLFFSKWLNLKKPEHPIFSTDATISSSQKAKGAILISLGATNINRQWQAGFYAEIINFLIDKSAYEIILLGSKIDILSAKKCLSGIRNENLDKVSNMVGKTSLIDLIPLFKNASLLISNESGLVHLATQLNLQTICISNGNHLGRFSPYPYEWNKPIKYIYPDEVSKIKDPFSENPFRYISKLSVNEISPSEVKKVISEQYPDNKY